MAISVATLGILAGMTYTLLIAMVLACLVLYNIWNNRQLAQARQEEKFERERDSLMDPLNDNEDLKESSKSTWSSTLYVGSRLHDSHLDQSESLDVSNFSLDDSFSVGVDTESAISLATIATESTQPVERAYETTNFSLDAIAVSDKTVRSRRRDSVDPDIFAGRHVSALSELQDTTGVTRRSVSKLSDQTSYGSQRNISSSSGHNREIAATKRKVSEEEGSTDFNISSILMINSPAKNHHTRNHNSSRTPVQQVESASPNGGRQRAGKGGEDGLPKWI